MDKETFYIQQVFQEAGDEPLSKHEISERLWNDYSVILSPLRVKCYLWSVFKGRLDHYKDIDLYYNLVEPFDEFYVDENAHKINMYLSLISSIGRVKTTDEISSGLADFGVNISYKIVANYLFGPFRDRIDYNRETKKISLVEPFDFENYHGYVHDSAIINEPTIEKGSHQELMELERLIEAIPYGKEFMIEEFLDQYNLQAGRKLVRWELEKRLEHFIRIVKKFPHGNSKYFKILPQVGEIKEEIKSEAT